MRKQKDNSIKSREEIDDIVRDLEKLVNTKGADALIEESISLDDFNNHVQQLLQEV